jgi:hypothetical protein
MPDQTPKKPSTPRVRSENAQQRRARWEKENRQFTEESEMTRKRLDRIEAAVSQMIFLKDWKPGDERNPGGTA